MNLPALTNFPPNFAIVRDRKIIYLFLFKTGLALKKKLSLFDDQKLANSNMGTFRFNLVFSGLLGILVP